MEFFFDDLRTSLAEQRRELELLETTEFDMNLAFRLQLEETIKASLQNLPSTSSSPLQQSSAPQQSKSDIVRPPIREELSKPQQTWKDLTRSEPGRSKLREDRDPRIPREIFRAWRDRFGESSSGSGSSSNSKCNRDGDDVFRVYFKGLVSRERLNLAGIGVVIFDPRNRVVSEIRKPLISDGLNRVAVEAKALIEGLNAAIALEVKNIEMFFNFHVLYQFITGRWPPKQRKIAVLVNQVSHLSRQFTSCKTLLVRNGSKYAFELAKEAIDSHFKGPVESSNDKSVSETCIICLEDTDPERMFSVEKCEHRYCFSCMKQHVEVKLLNGMLPQCPHEKCKSALQVESCQKFLPPKLVETMNQRIKEASIPVSEKIYCPYPKCSVLMTKKEVTEGGERSGARKCLKCHGLFCINCKVPWHINMTCEAYKRANPVPPAEDLKLKTLATRNLWRQCVKCNHMIELAEGCYHMTCRCGNEFCYNCGAEWKNKKATCACPLWDEDNVWYDDDFNDEGPIVEFDSDYEGSIIEYDSDYEGPIIGYASGYEGSIIEYASDYEGSIIEYASDYEGRPIIEYASDYEGSIIEYDSDYEGGPIVEYASDYEGSIIEYACDYEGGPIVEYASDYEGGPIVEYASDYEGPIIEYNSDYEVYESDDDYFF